MANVVLFKNIHPQMTFIYCSQILLFYYHHLHKTGIFHIKSAEIFHLLTLSPEGNLVKTESATAHTRSAESTDYMNSM